MHTASQNFIEICCHTGNKTLRSDTSFPQKVMNRFDEKEVLKEDNSHTTSPCSDQTNICCWSNQHLLFVHSQHLTQLSSPLPPVLFFIGTVKHLTLLKVRTTLSSTDNRAVHIWNVSLPENLPFPVTSLKTSKFDIKGALIKSTGLYI